MADMMFPEMQVEKFTYRGMGEVEHTVDRFRHNLTGTPVGMKMIPFGASSTVIIIPWARVIEVWATEKKEH